MNERAGVRRRVAAGVALALGLAWALAGCAGGKLAGPAADASARPATAPAAPAPVCPAGTERMLVADLFFGRSIDGPRPGHVSEADWNRFVADTLARAFPDGFTVRDAVGAWRDPRSGRTVTEATKDVVVALDDRPAALERVRSAMAVYRQRFHQHSVGLLLARACGAF